MVSSVTRALPLLLLGVAQAVAQKCPLQFDGRVPKNFTQAQFDANNALFNPGYVKGKGM